MAKLEKQLVTLARRGGGSFKTVSDRSKIASRFSGRLAMLNIQIRDIKHVKTYHIEKYVQSRLSENISLRTLQNEMAALRNILSSAGRTKLADPNHEKLSNVALGLSGASRDGTKVAISDEKFNQVIHYAIQKDEGVAIGVRLARYLGLRTEEVIQSVKSLKTWRQSIIKEQERVKVIFGTKGGRPRETTVFDREKVLSAIQDAIAYCERNNGRLIDKPNLHTAIERYRNIVREAGMTGENAPHSLRYAYARDAVNYHIESGVSRKEAEALVSMDLGHGDGRGHYVNRVYNKVQD
ncbi:TPA: integrase domain-containing protein [Salmonella enterica]|uniref:integrase domain-containing protein n=1 Tax=Salmonella enterica TaxID=28901 RepID=UPI0009B0C916|nr:integrase domain-containing protein [Salmonella enterica]HBD1844092.1 integrase domain-containing protein [Salmonella enterica]